MAADPQQVTKAEGRTADTPDVGEGCSTVASQKETPSLPAASTCLAAVHEGALVANVPPIADVAEEVAVPSEPSPTCTANENTGIVVSPAEALHVRGYRYRGV